MLTPDTSRNRQTNREHPLRGTLTTTKWLNDAKESGLITTDQGDVCARHSAIEARVPALCAKTRMSS